MLASTNVASRIYCHNQAAIVIKDGTGIIQNNVKAYHKCILIFIAIHNAFAQVRFVYGPTVVCAWQMKFSDFSM